MIFQPSNEQFAQESEDIKKLAVRLERITQTIESEELFLIEINIEGFRVFILSDDKNFTLPKNYLNRLRISTTLSYFLAKSGKCYAVAYDAYEAGVSSDRVHTKSADIAFIDFINHCINLDIQTLEDKTRYTAFDLTSKVNLDPQGDLLDLLIITCADLNLLISILGKLYGGDWSIIPRDEKIH